MPGESFRVKLVNARSRHAEGVFRLEGVRDDVALRLRWPGGELVERAADYFEALCQIRSRLEAVGWRPVCYGSAINVFPSGMGRDMAQGLKAHRLPIGRSVESSDLVDVFETESGLVPTSVEEQKQFWERWLEDSGC